MKLALGLVRGLFNESKSVLNKTDSRSGFNLEVLFIFNVFVVFNMGSSVVAKLFKVGNGGKVLVVLLVLVVLVTFDVLFDVFNGVFVKFIIGGVKVSSRG